MEELGIFCMDRRFNEFIEKNYPHMFVIRNAGANVKPILDEIRNAVQENSIRKITVFTHTDCGAMGKVFSVIKNNGNAEEELKETLINQFKSIEFSTKEELESKNLQIQLNVLTEEFPELKVEGKLLDAKKMEGIKNEKEHYLFIVKPGEPNYSAAFKTENLDPFQCYVVQSQVEASMPDISLAVNDLHADNIRLVINKADNPRESKLYEELLKLKFASAGKAVNIKAADIRGKERSSI
ncbi:MAG: carbonic anhydrase [Candidatus Micrarchaeaceae archaeon]